MDVYISYLRKKIDEGFKEKMIVTVRGVGYRGIFLEKRGGESIWQLKLKKNL